MQFEAGLHGLATHLLARLKDAWQTEATGVYEANAGHVAWFKRPGYLQLECDGPALRPGGPALPSDCGDVLIGNGFRPRDADHPLYWQRWHDEEDLDFGAATAAECIQLVLGGDPLATRWLPEFHAGASPVRPGTVVVITPLLKAMIAPGVVRSTAAGLGAAGPVAILDHLGGNSLGEAWPEPVDALEWLRSDRSLVDGYVHLRAPTLVGKDITGQLATVLDTSRIIDELKARGVSVVVNGYWLLPNTTWQYRELGRRIADRLVVVATDHDVAFDFGLETLERLLASEPKGEPRLPADILVVTYDDGHGPRIEHKSAPTLLGWPRFDLGQEADLAYMETWTCEEELARYLVSGLPAQASTP